MRWATETSLVPAVVEELVVWMSDVVVGLPDVADTEFGSMYFATTMEGFVKKSLEGSWASDVTKATK